MAADATSPFVLYSSIRFYSFLYVGAMSLKFIPKYFMVLLSNMNEGVRISISVFSARFSSVAQSCPTLCDSMNHSTPGLPVHQQLPEFTKTHVHGVSDAIQPSLPVVPFSSCPQSLPASESFPMSQLFA